MVVNNKKIKRKKMETIQENKGESKQETKMETKMESERPFTSGSLFNNPMIEAAMKALSPEDLERYKQIGEAMYGTVDFENSKILDNTAAPMAEAAAYIQEQLKSGLHPYMMDDDEKRLMLELFGNEWYTKWGYVEGDLTDIVTLVTK
jgi:hypothetical protein